MTTQVNKFSESQGFPLCPETIPGIRRSPMERLFSAGATFGVLYALTTNTRRNSAPGRLQTRLM